MAETVEAAVERGRGGPAPAPRLCLCEQYVRVTEGAALIAARWLGRADQDAAERDAAEAMRRVLDDFPIDGRVVDRLVRRGLAARASARRSAPVARTPTSPSIRSRDGASWRAAATARCR